MSIFKCKMCGGTLEINNSQTVAVCEYCGTKQTLPNLDDEKRANLYDRANHFRRNNEFDKASAIFEQILNEDGSDAEAYWSLVLCRYGIEYVEDPSMQKRVPTVNRAQFTSIFDDDNYKSALRYADSYQKSIYEDEANAINEIQKGILAISQKEEPFDVFICYKESDNNGRRTPDSVLATELYHELSKEGFKVFFSRITLEDKLGQEYEPYIFAALNSAKVMVVLGTKPDFFNAVWVKNEWSRFLALIKNGSKKMLIPAYKDMDPYNLPEEFSHLQAQDMSKLGFMQDLVRGIKKIIGTEETNTTIKRSVPSESGINVEALLKRAFIFLEDNNWDNADGYLEKVLDADPENAMAYVGKLMLELRVSHQGDLSKLTTPFDDNSYYEKAIRYADASLKSTLQGYIATINERNERTRLETAYQEATDMMNSAEDEFGYIEASEKFASISNYSDASELSSKCSELAENAHNEVIYQSACQDVSRETMDMSSKVFALERAISQFEQIPDYKDSADQISKLKLDIEELNKKIEIKRKKIKKDTIIATSSLAILVAFLLILFNFIIPAVKYSMAAKHIENKEYLKAVTIYEDLTDYKDSADKLISSRYLLATSQLESKDYQNAYNNFSMIKDYEDSKAKHQESGYGYAQTLITDKKYQEAIDVFNNIGNYENSADLKEQCYLEGAKQFHANKEYLNAITWYEKIKEFDKNAEFYKDSCYNYGIQQNNSGNYTSAVSYLDKAGDYKSAKDLVKTAKYKYVVANKNRENKTTFEYLKDLKAAGYQDSADIYKELYAWKLKIVANDDENNETTDMNSISKYSNWYFHVSLSGGEPGGEVKLKYTGYFPDGDTSSGAWDGTWADGYSGTCWFYYNTPAYGHQGTFKVKFFDGQGNVLGEKSIRITG